MKTSYYILIFYTLCFFAYNKTDDHPVVDVLKTAGKQFIKGVCLGSGTILITTALPLIINAIYFYTHPIEKIEIELARNRENMDLLNQQMRKYRNDLDYCARCAIQLDSLKKYDDRLMAQQIVLKNASLSRPERYKGYDLDSLILKSFKNPI